MAFDRVGLRGRVSDYHEFDRVVEESADVDRYVDVRNLAGAVHRIDVDTLNDRGELHPIPAGEVHEVGVWRGDERERTLGPFDGSDRAAEVATRLATEEELPVCDPIPRLLPTEAAREERRREGRWPPHRDEAREFRVELPDDVVTSPKRHGICVRICVDPDPDPPTGDDTPLDAFDDCYDVALTHNTTQYDVVERIESGIESRNRAIESLVEAAREREWAVHTRMSITS